MPALKFYTKNVCRFNTPDRPDLHGKISSITKTLIKTVASNDNLTPIAGDVIYLEGNPYIICRRIIRPYSKRYNYCEDVIYEVVKWNDEVPPVTEIKD